MFQTVSKKNLAVSLSLLFSILSFSQITKEFNVDNFDKIVLEGASYFTLIQSDLNKVEVVIEDEEILDFIKTTVENKVLTINTVSKNKNVNKTCSSLNFKIYFKDIEKVDFAGAGSVTGKGIIESDKLEVILGGAGNVKVEVNCQLFTGKMNGAGSLEVIGLSKKTELFVRGIGNVKASTLVSEDTFVTLSGVGYAEVFANKKLEAKLNGIGTIKYAGDPSSKNFEINGIGSVKALN